MRYLLVALISIFGFTLIALVNPVEINAAQGCTNDIPDACPTPGDYEPDYACVIARTINTPTTGRTDCCLNKCKNVEANPGLISPEFRELSAFNANIKITYDKIPSIINLGFSTFLAFIAIYAAIRGIYIYAIKLPNTTDQSKIAEVTKEARAILIGFILAISFLFLTQIIFSILGLGNINDIQFSYRPGDTVEGPQIVIQ